MIVFYIEKLGLIGEDKDMKKTTKKEAEIVIDEYDTKPKLISTAKMIELSEKGVSYSDVARILGCSKQTVSARLKKIDYTPQSIKDYRENEANMLSLVRSRIVLSLDADTIQKANLLQRTTSLGILLDKERLITGQSTGNIAVKHVFESIIEDSHKNPAKYI
ncbi:MAG: helix-turn-helix domain-containing protein [Candidatus Anammoxibacter sp.]